MGRREDLAELRAAYEALPPEDRPEWEDYLDQVGAEITLMLEAGLQKLGVIMGETAFRHSETSQSDAFRRLGMRYKFYSMAAYIRSSNFYHQFTLEEQMRDDNILRL
ncbi:MAG: hypothetical protein IJS44_01310 [Clostridia bacterium]|nr:hypothetical protein [Clostridia bacterium]